MIGRRRLLQALGLAGGGLFLPSVRGARAATSPAKRVVFFVTNHGVVYDQWRMRLGHPEDRDFELDLRSTPVGDWSPILAPLQPWAQKLLVLDGLGNGCGIAAAFNEHEEGCASVLTGRVPRAVEGSLGVPDGPSIDQVIADSRSTPFRSLEYALGGWPVNYDARGQALPYEGDVLAAWSRLFPNGTSGTEPTEADRIAGLRTSVLDLAADRFEALAPRLSSEDRAKLEQHRDLLRDLEARVGSLAELRCEAMAQPDDPYPEYLWGDAGYPAYVSGIFADLVAAALSCGHTEVVTYRLDHVNNSTIGAPPGDLHNDFAHQASTDPTAGAVMTDYHVFLARRLAEILGALDAIPEGGGTLLDHTLVVWTNEVATGEHSFVNLPVVIAGGSGVLRTGRYVRWAPTFQLAGPWDQPWIGPPHNRLLTTLGVATGLDLDAFGVTELPAADGGTVDCTGTLDRVLA